MSSPAIILLSPQMGENIGAAARVMHNFGLEDLRLITPRDGWPSARASETSRNAVGIINNARVYASIAEASHNIQHLYATTARPRDMAKTVLTPRECASSLRGNAQNQHKSAIIFGPERIGLTNDDLVLADNLVIIPVSEANPSLNLAQAVAVLCYEWFIDSADGGKASPGKDTATPATKSEMAGLLAHLEQELTESGFFYLEKMKDRMLRNLSNIFTRNNLTSQEISTLHGVINSLAGKK